MTIFQDKIIKIGGESMFLKILSTILVVVVFITSYYFYIIKVNVQTTESTINYQESPWKANVFNSGQDKNVKAFYVFDENFIIGDTFEENSSVLFKTKDKGITWEKFYVMQGYTVGTVDFLDPNIGFLIATKYDGKNSFIRQKIMVKTEDGGAHWKEVYSSPKGYFSSLNFNKTGVGIAFGEKTLSDKESDVGTIGNFRTFLLITKDYGNTWTDISDRLNSVLEISKGNNAETLEKIIFLPDNDLLGVSSNNKFYKSKNYGESWSEVSKIVYDFMPEIGVLDFGELENGKLWASGSARSMEGRLAAVSTLKYGNTWNNYKLDNYYFNDVEFLSNSEVIAAGVKLLKGPFKTEEKSKGTILSSADGGKSWETVYESTVSEAFNPDSIKKISERKLIALGDKGEIVVLERK